MPLETANFISDLIPSNPAHTDGLNQADSHIRLLKSVLKTTLPNFTDVALGASQAQIDAAVAVTAGTAVHVIPSGTQLLPGLAFAGDPDTGIFSNGPNQLDITIGGVQQASITPGAAVFIGGIACSAVVSVGAYSGGTGQLVPIGATIMWWDEALPAEGGYVWANGAAISRTTYPLLFSRWGTKYGAGDGSTTFGTPNLQNVVPVGRDNMGSKAGPGLLSNITTSLLQTLGAVFGLGTATITTPNLPAYTPSGGVAVQNGGISINGQGNLINAGQGQGVGGGGAFGIGGQAPLSASQNASAAQFAGNAQGGSSTPMNNVQPSMTVNWIIRAA